MKIQLYLLDIKYKVFNDKPVIYLFGRTIDSKQVCVTDDTFEPYFYVLPESNPDNLANELARLRIEKQNSVYSVTKAEVITKELLGKPIKIIKAYTNLPASVPILRDELKNHKGIKDIFEYDILFVRRYLIDKGITPLTLVEADGDFITQRSRVPVFKAASVRSLGGDTIETPKILAFDIETYSPFGKDIVPEESPILMIAFHGDNFEKIITWKKFKTELATIEFVANEQELIHRFVQVINEYGPDIIAGYFSDGFDFPYLKVRGDKFNIKLDVSLDYSDIRLNTGRAMSVSLAGIIHLDVFKFIRGIMFRSLKTDTLDLDSVAKELLNEKKHNVEITQLVDVWDNRPEQLEEFCAYNLHDAVLTFNLAKKILPNIIELVKIVNLPVDDISRMAFSQLVEWYLIKQAPLFNQLVPNKPHNNEIGARKKQRYEGAFVFEPKPGLHKDIVIFDYRSLYPTIISSHNISPSTLNCSCCKDKEKVPGLDYWFCKDKKGFLSIVIEDLIRKRMRVKEVMKQQTNIFLNARQESLKLLANAFYGYLGFYAARWYSIECAKSVTAYGRYYIKKVISEAGKNKFDVLYSDTDSVFLLLGEKKKKDAISFADKINKDLPGIMELEYEGFYPVGIFVSAKVGVFGAKKRYALLDENGDIKITGFEVVRRNISPIAKEVQENVLNIILREENPEKAFEYVKDIVNKLRTKEVPLSKVIIFTQLQKYLNEYDQIGPHVAAAQRMLNKGVKIGPGSPIRYVIIQGKEIIRDRARLPDEVDETDYDADYYIQHQVVPSVEKIFEILGYNKEQLLETKSQSKLDKFF